MAIEKVVPMAGGAPKGSVTRLGTPTAFVMLIGLFLVYYALRGFDKKYGTFSGTFAGAGNVPTGTTPRYAASNTAAALQSATVPSGGTPQGTLTDVAVPAAPTTSTTVPLSQAIITLQKYIANLKAVKNPSASQRAELALYEQRLATYQARQSV